MLVALPLVTLVLLALGGTLYVLRRRAAGARPSARVLCWLAVPAAGLVLAAAWCALGLYEGGAAEMLVLCVAALVAGAAALAREKFVAWVRSRGEGQPGGAAPTRALVAVAAVLVCVVLGFLALELTYNATAPSIALNYAAIEMAIILGATLVLFFLLQRRGAGPAIVVALCWVIGLAQYFVARFKASAILPNDLFVLETAAAVSGNYVYAVNGAVLMGLSCVMLASAAASLVVAARAETSEGLARRTLVNLGCALAAIAAHEPVV